MPRRPLMVRAALLRRDGAATESLLRRSCADQLRRAHSARLVSTRCAERGDSIIFPRVDLKLNFNGRGPQS